MDKSFEHFYSSVGISTDTRNIEQNSLFVCIKGDNFDGNTFAHEALKQGAKHVIVDNEEYFDKELNMTLVDNSIEYLQKLANYHRRKFNIPVIGITGSNGKTTSKELINSVLSKKYNVLATIGNLNNHLGVPFTLLRLNSQHDIAIIEMGANKPEDIKELCAIAEPTHGIITNIGKAHLEGFKTLQGVITTKKELYDSIEDRNGKLFINSDDQTLINILPERIETIKYGTNGTENVTGELVALSPFVEMKWNAKNYSSEVLKMQMIGKYNFYNYLAAIAFGREFNVSEKSIDEALIEYAPENKRSQVAKTDKNTLILDCYNANPTSMQSALESFSMNKAENKICILGDMKELGPDSTLEHEKIITLLEEYNIQAYLVGSEFFKLDSCNILQKKNTVEELIEFIQQFPIENKIILIKGSNSIHLDRLETSL